MSATNLHRIVIEDCIEYFSQQGIPAYEDDSSVYITIEGFDSVQISKAEVLYRADLFKSEVNS